MAQTVDLLRVSDVTKTFQGYQALQGVNLHISEGEIVSVIGPNGAGKTTLFNQITGYSHPDKGTILFNGRRIDRLKTEAIVRRGIGRSFQRSNIFSRLSVYDNILAGVVSQQGRQGSIQALDAHQSDHSEVIQILDRIGLSGVQDQIGGQLALGDQKRLEIGLVLAMKPRLLLLDEPTAGMSQDETHQIVELVTQLTRSSGLSMLFTEHDMAIVFSVSDRIYVLNQGQIVFEGRPTEVAASPLVQQVYLGKPL